jgi:hypothetical protein
MIRAALLVAGLWLGLLVASWLVAATTFRTASHVLSADGGRQELAVKMAPLDGADRLMVMRHLASEINRSMFRTWAFLQLGLAAVLAALLWRAPGAARLLAFVAFGLMLAQAAGLGPAIASYGRSLDFVPRPLAPQVARGFGLLHAAYVIGDLIKAGLLAAAAVVLVRRG